eukprot:SAG11_NODE_27703_length_330_cov_0.632035_1_plen_110_part_11
MSLRGASTPHLGLSNAHASMDMSQQTKDVREQISTTAHRFRVRMVACARTSCLRSDVSVPLDTQETPARLILTSVHLHHVKTQQLGVRSLRSTATRAAVLLGTTAKTALT